MIVHDLTSNHILASYSIELFSPGMIELLSSITLYVCNSSNLCATWINGNHVKPSKDRATCSPIPSGVDDYG